MELAVWAGPAEQKHPVFGALLPASQQPYALLFSLLPLMPKDDPAKPVPSMGKAALKYCHYSSDQVPNINLVSVPS